MERPADQGRENDNSDNRQSHQQHQQPAPQTNLSSPYSEPLNPNPDATTNARPTVPSVDRLLEPAEFTRLNAYLAGPGHGDTVSLQELVYYFRAPSEGSTLVLSPRGEDTVARNQPAPSPFLQSIADTADRIAIQSPSLGLNGGLPGTAQDEDGNRAGATSPVTDENATTTHSEIEAGSVGTTRERANTGRSLESITDRLRTIRGYTEGPLFDSRRSELTPQTASASRPRQANTGNNPERVTGNSAVSLPDRSGHIRRDIDRLMRDYSVARRAQPEHVRAARFSGPLRLVAGMMVPDDSDNLSPPNTQLEQDSEGHSAGMLGSRANRRYTEETIRTLETLISSSATSPMHEPSSRSIHTYTNNQATSTPSTALISPSSGDGAQTSSRLWQSTDRTRDLLDRLRPNTTTNSAALDRRPLQPTANRLGPHADTRTRRHFGNTEKRSASSSETESRKKAKNVMLYLSWLMSAEKTDTCPVALAQQLGIDSIQESLQRCSVFDLPMKAHELPITRFSSWLEPGVSWSGQQVSKNPRTLNVENARRRANGGFPYRRGSDNDSLILSLRASRHRERLRAERILRQRQLSDRIAQTDPNIRMESLFSGLNLTSSIEDLADMERQLSRLLEATESSVSDHREWRLPRPVLNQSPVGARIETKDRWPVSVTIHSVDWAKMTLTGTMSASHIPDRSTAETDEMSDAQGQLEPQQPSNSVEVDEAGDARTSSIESFFDGEIIDFRHNEIETLSNKVGYKSGGLGVDVEYWAGIGPFKEEVEKVKHAMRYEKAAKKSSEEDPSTAELCTAETHSSSAGNEAPKARSDDTTRTRSGSRHASSSSSANPSTEAELDAEEHDRAVDEAMTQCLGSRKWMEDKLSKEWILMRWKERCFVLPADSTARVSSSSPRDVSNAPNFAIASGRIAALESADRSAGPRRQANPSTSNSRANTTLGTLSSTTYTPHDNASWGLTISGFYYIALHRQTGRIEGLYYDPGSQPYQRLIMRPLGFTSEAGSASNSGVPQDASFSHNSTGINTQGDILGIRRCFPSIEFR